MSLDYLFSVLTGATVFLLLLPLVYLIGRLMGVNLDALQLSLSRLAKVINGINEVIGTFASWLALIMVLVQTIVVIQRYVFGISFIELQESIMYMHGIMFLLAAGYTLKHNGHVRVDIFYRQAGRIPKAVIDFVGCYVFLFPVMWVIIEVAFPYVELSWLVKEGSNETSGIPYVYLLKSNILFFAVLMLAQGLELAIRNAFVLTGDVTAEAKPESLTF